MKTRDDRLLREALHSFTAHDIKIHRDGCPVARDLTGRQAADTLRPLTSLTASSLRSWLNFRFFRTLALRFPETPWLGAHQTGSRPRR